MKTLLTGIGFCLIALGGVLVYMGYQEHINPKYIYGNWVELNVRSSVQDVYTFSERGVYRNNHLLTTKLKYDGDSVQFSTGEGKSIYQIAGTTDLQQLKRVHPPKPQQILIRESDEAKFNVREPLPESIRPIDED